MKAKLSGK
jgi:NAD(P)-dependent dehydrogenase (short-subunit alcohol dehydrogenase family)